MKTIKILLGAALLGSLLSSTVFASVENYRKNYQSVVTRTDIPLPAKVVAPSDLSRRYVGATVVLRLTVDEAGQPRDISVVQPIDPELSQSVIAAMAQWRFTPAQKDGKPVATRVELPIHLVAEA